MESETRTLQVAPINKWNIRHAAVDLCGHKSGGSKRMSEMKIYACITQPRF
jgi:hypothetical protein